MMVSFGSNKMCNYQHLMSRPTAEKYTCAVP